jgi:hypothetical protein
VTEENREEIVQTIIQNLHQFENEMAQAKAEQAKQQHKQQSKPKQDSARKRHSHILELRRLEGEEQSTLNSLESMIQSGVKILKLLPSNASPHMILVTDCGNALPLDSLDNLLSTLSADDIALSVISVGSSSLVSVFGYLPDFDAFRHLALAAYGSFYSWDDWKSITSSQRNIRAPELMPGIPEEIAKLSVFQAKFLLRVVSLQERNFVGFSSLRSLSLQLFDREYLTEAAQRTIDDHPYPWVGAAPFTFLFTAPAGSSVIPVSFSLLLEGRLREGFCPWIFRKTQSTAKKSSTTSRASRASEKFELKLLLPWRQNVKLLCTLKPVSRFKTEVVLEALAYYEFFQVESLVASLRNNINRIKDADKGLSQIVADMTPSDNSTPIMFYNFDPSKARTFWNSLASIGSSSSYYFSFETLEVVLIPSCKGGRTGAPMDSESLFSFSQPALDTDSLKGLKFTKGVAELNHCLSTWSDANYSKQFYLKFLTSIDNIDDLAPKFSGSPSAGSSPSAFSVLGSSGVTPYCFCRLIFEAQGLVTINMLFFAASPAERFVIFKISFFFKTGDNFRSEVFLCFFSLLFAGYG